MLEVSLQHNHQWGVFQPIVCKVPPQITFYALPSVVSSNPHALVYFLTSWEKHIKQTQTFLRHRKHLYEMIKNIINSQYIMKLDIIEFNIIIGMERLHAFYVQVDCRTGVVKVLFFNVVHLSIISDGGSQFTTQCRKSCKNVFNLKVNLSTTLIFILKLMVRRRELFGHQRTC